jgi:cell wall-associated NlpC family hydrolase
VSPEAVGGTAAAASPGTVVGSAPAPGVAAASGAVVEPGVGAAPAAPGAAEVPGTGAVAASPEAVAGAPAVAPSVAEVPSAGVGAAVAEPGAVAYPGAAGVYPAVVPSESAVASAQEYVGGAVAGHAAAEAVAAAHDPNWASLKAHEAYEIAKSELGVPYLWGGTSPKTGFDCSGLVQYAYGHAGIHIPRVAAEQFDVGTPVGLHQLHEGDLVFFKEPNGYIHHVGIYVGDDKFIQAPCTGQNVDYGDLREPYFAQQFAGGRRIVPLSAPPAPAVAAEPVAFQAAVQPVAAEPVAFQATVQPGAAEPAAFQATVQPAAGTAGAVPMAATGAATPEAVVEPAVAAPAVPGGAVAASTPGVPAAGAVAEPAVGVPAEPVVAAPVTPSVPAGAVPVAGQEISPGVHLYSEPLPVEPAPQPGTAVFKALQVQEASYLRHTVQFLQAVPPPSAEPPTVAAPDAVAQAPGAPAAASEVPGQSPAAGTGAAPGEAVVGSTPGVPAEAAVPGQGAVVEQSAYVPGQAPVVEQSAYVPGQAPGMAEAAGVVDAASSGTIPYPGDNAPKAEIAQWMGDLAQKHGLPRELPVMASLVESSLHNDNFGDRDSLGYFQMRTSIWDKGNYAGYPNDPALQVKWFIDQALAVKNQMPDRHFGSNPANFGEWIDEIERPAEEYRGRYQLQLSAAQELLGKG